MRPVALIAAALAAVGLASPPAGADGFVTVRGAYYREASTRVIQPTVEVARNSDSEVDVEAHYLLDAITSASVAAGTATDSVFTETRNEVGLSLRKRFSRSEVSAGYKYSAESDYWSHAIGASAARSFWGDTARVSLSAGVNLDSVGFIHARTPPCSSPPTGLGYPSCPLHGFFGGLSYTQVLSPDWLAQLSLESLTLEGFQANPYRTVPNHGYELLPSSRVRNALAARVAAYLPALELAVRLQARYYFDVAPELFSQLSDAHDPWHVQSATFELRVYRPLTRSLDVRLSYRQYVQWGARFWCDAIANPICYGPDALYYSTDPKLGPVHTEYPEIQLAWEAAALAGIPVLGWLSAGTFEISYGRYFQNTSFGDAHLLQSGYTMPFE